MAKYKDTYSWGGLLSYVNKQLNFYPVTYAELNQ